MFEVIIQPSDPQRLPYKAFFPTREEATAWSNTPRPKWGVGYTVQIIDRTAEVAAQKAAEDALKTALQAIKQKASSRAPLTTLELGQAVEFLLTRAGI